MPCIYEKIWKFHNSKIKVEIIRITERLKETIHLETHIASNMRFGGITDNDIVIIAMLTNVDIRQVVGKTNHELKDFKD